MCVTVLANLTAERQKESGILGYTDNRMIYFNLQDEIIPYFDTNWEHLTNMPRRTKNTWHSTVQKTLAKESDLFKPLDSSENSFALVETSLTEIGPNSEAVKQIGKKNTEKANLASTLVSAQQTAEKSSELADADGPKTRGASKRRNAETGGGPSKKMKNTVDYSSARVTGQDMLVDFPFNKEGYHYFLAERDPNIQEKVIGEEEESAARIIPPYLYRLNTIAISTVTLSPNDRAFQLRLMEDQLTVTGNEGYCVARATHGVMKGTWYYEVHFQKQPPDSHIRIGWSQRHTPVQACVGYTKFSYGWRSLKGTKFHDSYGAKYFQGGFKEGDVLGCLIHLPWNQFRPGPSQNYIQPSLKDQPLIVFKHNHFFESHEDGSESKKKLVPFKGSRVFELFPIKILKVECFQIEFFRNGKSCGVAFDDIYAGAYYPAVSLFQNATLKCNFGPKFAFPPPQGALPMSERANQVHYEQTLSDIINMTERELEL
ncbi:hypothetical protein WR25_24066 [Diploscapter pachys]|uniref:B30.2/SPRY domain-containing protein n=1 Tax=Diploscapter pachys TaxID=2018661 RepID=A0A2A2K894_9BILA|nr:hypothetical protein WR25_24066 [Diploscapter pachys]